MSKPIPGDTVLTMFYPAENSGLFGGIVAPAIVLRVHDNNAIDALCAAINPGTGQDAAWGARFGLTEVSSTADLVATTFNPDGSIATPGTWCRREVCG